MLNFTSHANDLPPLDFNPDPNVVARARVALIVNQARQNQRDSYLAARLELIAVERALEEFQ
jgi:hypothetical protein